MPARSRVDSDRGDSVPDALSANAMSVTNCLSHHTPTKSTVTGSLDRG